MEGAQLDDEPLQATADDTSAAIGAPRRVFLVPREVPRLVLGVSLGDAAALRRVLGARRGGRYGVLLSGALALLAAPAPPALAIGLIGYAAFSLVAAIRYGEAEGLGVVQCLRLMLWTLPGPLLLALVFRIAGSDSALPLLLAAVGGYLLLDGGLRAGLAADPDPY